MNCLLKNETNFDEWVEIHDSGQGSLPNEGNCGFLTMSQFMLGTERNYYALRIFFSYVYQSLSTLPESHPLLNETFSKENDVWSQTRLQLDFECPDRILSFVTDENVFSVEETNELTNVYKIPTEYVDEYCSNSPIVRRRMTLHNLGSMVRDTRFWASSLEFNILSRVCNFQIVILQAIANKEPISENLREWQLNMHSHTFDNGQGFPSLVESHEGEENLRRMCFLAVVEQQHFVGLKLIKDPNTTKNKIEAWLENRTDKLLIEDGDKYEYDGHDMGKMFNLEETLYPFFTSRNIKEEDRLSIVRALDPLKTDTCAYTGVDNFRILTLRDCSWLDCSTISRILTLQRSNIPTTMKLKLWPSYWISKDFKKKPLGVGYFHCLICNVANSHWITMEVDDRVSPRPESVSVHICDKSTLADKYLDLCDKSNSTLNESDSTRKQQLPWNDVLKEMFYPAKLEFVFDTENDEKQNGYDCGIVALRRIIVRIKLGPDHKININDYDYLGKNEESRLSFVYSILKNSNTDVKGITIEELRKLNCCAKEQAIANLGNKTKVPGLSDVDELNLQCKEIHLTDHAGKKNNNRKKRQN